MTDTALPSFRYHPDPVATGAFERRTGTCRSCGQTRRWLYAVQPYATIDLRDAICPWCVADGSAAARFDAVFTDLGEPGTVPPDIAATVLDEVQHRTPGFSGWQQERWMFCCGDAAAFLGSAGWAELSHLPDALACLRAQAVEWGLDGEEAEAFTESLDLDSSPTAYVFRCLTCGSHLAYADLD